MRKIVLLPAIFLLLMNTTYSQTFTMGKKCREALATAQAVLESGAYSDALGLYEAFSDKCRTRDAKEAAAIGMAEAYNGLGRYDEAIVQADAALKVTKDRSLGGHFQKALAYEKLGNPQGARMQFQRMMDLTEKNRNTAERASNYALIADLYASQMGQVDSAMAYLDKARAMDPGNFKYTLQEGDIYLSAGDYDRAYASYEAAAASAPNSLDVYVAKSDVILKKMEEKYGTSSSQELNGSMTAAEKAQLCADLSKAFDLGYKDMNKELFKTLICN